MSVREFFAMGGYAVYVWPAYAVTLAVLVLNVFTARANHKRALTEARRRLQSREGNV